MFIRIWIYREGLCDWPISSSGCNSPQNNAPLFSLFPCLPSNHLITSFISTLVQGKSAPDRDVSISIIGQVHPVFWINKIGIRIVAFLKTFNEWLPHCPWYKTIEESGLRALYNIMCSHQNSSPLVTPNYSIFLKALHSLSYLHAFAHIIYSLRLLSSHPPPSDQIPFIPKGSLKCHLLCQVSQWTQGERFNPPLASTVLSTHLCSST